MGAGAEAGSSMGSILGGIVGHIASNADRQNAENSYGEAVQKLLDIGAPPDMARAVAIQQFKVAGTYTPEMEQAVELDKARQVNKDQEAISAQRQALSGLAQQTRQGLTPALKADLVKQQMDTEAAERQRQASIIQNLQARGQGGSGAELAAMFGSDQGAANRQSLAGLQAVGQATDAQRSALSQYANLGGQMRGQQNTEEEADIARDVARNQFNTANTISRQSRNVGAKNQAQQQNLSEAQRIADANVQAANLEAYRQRQGELQNYQNQVGRAQIQSGAYGMRGNAQAGKAAETGKFYTNIATGIGGGMGAAVDAMSGQPPGGMGGGGGQGAQNFMDEDNVSNQYKQPGFGSRYGR